MSDPTAADASVPAENPLTLRELLDRAAQDDEFLARLAQTPIRTLVDEGLRLNFDQLKTLFAIPGATDRELVQVLRSRVATADEGIGVMGGCGCS
jgi:hypothetical protein